MGIVIRQSIKSTIISYGGAFIGMISVIYIYPRFLTPEIIGLTRLLLEIAFILTFLSQLGVTNSIIKFYPYFKTEDKRDNGFLFYVLIFPLIGFIFISVLFLLFKNEILHLFSGANNYLNTYYYYIIPLVFFTMYINLSEIYASVKHKIIFPKIVKEVIIRLLTILTIVLFSLQIFDLDSFIISFVMVYLIGMLSDLIFLFKFSSIHIPPNTGHIDNSLKTEIVKFAGFVLLAGSGGTLINRIDLFMISSKLNLSNAGIFSLCFYIGAFIEMPSRALVQILSPFTSHAIKNNNWDEVNLHYRKSSLHQFLIGSIIFILIWINIDNIFDIMPNGQLYKQGKYVVFFIGISKLIDAATSLNIFILGNSRYYYYIIFLTIFLGILTLVTNYFLIPTYGINGAGLASCSSIIIYNIVVLWIVFKKLKVHPLSPKLLGIMILSVGCLLFSHLIPRIFNPYLDCIIRSSVIFTFYVFIIVRFKFSEEIFKIYQKIIGHVL